MIKKVLYNALGLTGNFSGVQNYSYHLLREAQADPESRTFFNALLPAATRKSYFPDDFTPCPVSGKYRRVLYEQMKLPGRIGRQSDTLLHAPASVLPSRFASPSVLTVHDTIPLDFPEYFRKSRAIYFNRLLKKSITRADRIIAVSERTKADILRHCPALSPERIHVIYQGIDDSFRPLPHPEQRDDIRSRYSLPEKYMLFVGNLEPRKNLVRLLQAYALLPEKIEHKLVVAGQWGWKYREIKKALGELSPKKKVFLLDYVHRDDLCGLYSGADLFLFPSLYEGFGLPPLEAMACGVPVLCSDRGALPEIIGENAMYADPCSEEEWAYQMEVMLDKEEGRKSLVQKGLAHSRNFRWEKTWRQTREVYRSILEA